MAGDIRPVLKSIKFSPEKSMYLRLLKVLQLTLQFFYPSSPGP